MTIIQKIKDGHPHNISIHEITEEEYVFLQKEPEIGEILNEEWARYYKTKCIPLQYRDKQRNIWVDSVRHGCSSFDRSVEYRRLPKLPENGGELNDGTGRQIKEVIAKAEGNS